MRYDAEQVEYLAAEYVLGTLHGAARRRFDRLITEQANVRFTVWRWERHLNGIASALEPRQLAHLVEPFEQVAEILIAVVRPRTGRGGCVIVHIYATCC